MKKSKHIDSKTTVNNKNTDKVEINDDLKTLTMEDQNLGTPVVHEIKNAMTDTATSKSDKNENQLSSEKIWDYKLDSIVLQSTAKSGNTKQKLSATTALQTERANYRKYPEVKDRLIAMCIEGKKSAKEMADELGLSIHTFYKYKSMAMVEYGHHFRTIDEVLYNKK